MSRRRRDWVGGSVDVVDGIAGNYTRAYRVDGDGQTTPLDGPGSKVPA